MFDNNSNLKKTKFHKNILFTAQKLLNDSGLQQRYLIIVKKIIDFFDKWELAQKRGVAICQAIENIKLKSLDNREKGLSLYPQELNGYCNKLKILVSIFEDVINYLKETKRQLEALHKLSKDNGPIFRSWDSNQFCLFIDLLLERSEIEYTVKIKVMENIAHSESKVDLAMHSLIWEYPQSFLVHLILNLSNECL